MGASWLNATICYKFGTYTVRAKEEAEAGSKEMLGYLKNQVFA